MWLKVQVAIKLMQHGFTLKKERKKEPHHEPSSGSLSHPAGYRSSSPTAHDLEPPHPHPMQRMRHTQARGWTVRHIKRLRCLDNKFR